MNNRKAVAAALIGICSIFVVFLWIEYNFPGSGWVVQKSDGLIKGVPLRIDFIVRM